MSSLKKLDEIISQIEKTGVTKKSAINSKLKGRKGGAIQNFAGGAVKNFAGSGITNFAGGKMRPIVNYAGLHPSLMRPIKLLIANELEKKGGALVNKILKGKGLTGGKCKCGMGLTGGKKCGMGLTGGKYYKGFGNKKKGGITTGGVRTGGTRTGGVKRIIEVGGGLTGGKKKKAIPPQLREWHKLVAQVRAEHPDLPYREQLQMAKSLNNGK